MNGMIDETELARLEYLIEASESCGYSTKSDDPNMQYLAAACHYTPALIAEIRRLRRNYECSEKSLQRHEHMVAELMEKVEAWEWYNECRIYDPWREHQYCTACGRSSHLRKDQNSIGTRRARALENAIAEWHAIVEAAREAVHAYRK